tara:strand:- start:882 stop:2123 length:1242 start_codon:yes stop_codon:yes gene_type:complete
MKNFPKNFCPQPFTYIYPNHHGAWKPCCKCQNYPQKKISFDEWWYEDKELKDLRNTLLSDTPYDEWNENLQNVCERCFGPESRGVKSYRQHSVDSWSHPSVKDNLLDMINSFKETGKLVANQRTFIVKVRGFGNECNLKCYMCVPHNSTARNTELLKANEDSVKIFYPKGHQRLIKNKTIPLDNEYEKQQMYDVIEKMGPYIAQFNFSGGEPVMIKEYYELMDKIIETGQNQNVRIHMNSNLTRLNLGNKHLEEYIPKFKMFFIQASIDDIYERDEWSRYPSKFEKVMENYKYLQNNKKIQIIVHPTWSLLNVANAENILNFFLANSMRINDNINFVSNPSVLHIKNYPHKDFFIEKYKNSKFKMVRELSLELQAEFNQAEFLKAINYIKDLDRIRKTKSWEVYPELSEFLKP